MKRGSRILIFLVVIIVILVAVTFIVLRGGGGGIFGSSAPTPTPQSPMVNIVIAGQPINRDDEIIENALSTMPYPQDKVTSKMITDMKSVIGKFAIYPLSQGMPLTTDMVSDRPGMDQPGSKAAKVVSPGLVAISIPISRLDAVAFGIKDGDKVNVIATNMFLDVDSSYQSKLPNYTAKVTGSGTASGALPDLAAVIASGGQASEQGRAELDPTLNQAIYIVPSEGQRARLVSQMILQDIQVLHVGDFSLTDSQTQNAQAQQPAPGTTPTPAPAPKLPDVITLIVTPQDAVALTYMMNAGTRFTLALRAPDDTSRVDTEAATLQYLLSQYAIPVPAKLPYVIDNNSVKATPTPAP